MSVPNRTVSQLGSRRMHRSDKLMYGVSLAVTFGLAWLWLSTSLMWRDVLLLGASTPFIAYFSVRRAVLPMRVAPDRFGTSRLRFAFNEHVTVPLSVFVPLVSAATLVGLFDFAQNRLPMSRQPQRPLRFHLYAAACNSAAVVCAGAAARTVIRWVPGTVGDVIAIGVAVPLAVALAQLGASLLLFCEKGSFLSPRFLAMSLVTAGGVLAPLGVGLTLGYRSHNYVIVAVLMLLAVVFVELLRVTFRSQMELGARNEERKELLGHLIGAGENQRRLLAGDLHDGPLQAVLAVRLLMEDVEDYVSDGALDRAREGSERIRDSLAEVATELRDLMKGLTPQPFVELGLRGGLERDQEVFGVHFSHGFHLDYRLTSRPDDQTENLLYRVIHEAVLNALRHASAGSIEVSLEEYGDEIRVRVADDGQGLDLDEALVAYQRGHFGLSTIRERVELAGGRFRVEQPASGGTRILVAVPLTVREQPETYLPRASAALPGMTKG
jgi:signal transduction histidine kinase